MVNNREVFAKSSQVLCLYLTREIIVIRNEAGLKFEGKIGALSIILETKSVITTRVFLGKISLRILRKHVPIQIMN